MIGNREVCGIVLTAVWMKALMEGRDGRGALAAKVVSRAEMKFLRDITTGSVLQEPSFATSLSMGGILLYVTGCL